MSELFRKISRVSWLIMIALLPISSMPLVAKLLGSDSVASPAILFMLVLLMTWFLPRVFRGEGFSNHILPLLITRWYRLALPPENKWMCNSM